MSSSSSFEFCFDAASGRDGTGDARGWAEVDPVVAERGCGNFEDLAGFLWVVGVGASTSTETVGGVEDGDSKNEEDDGEDDREEKEEEMFGVIRVVWWSEGSCG